MKKLSLSIAIMCAGGLSGCVTTPPLEEATGTADSNIMIKDVVQRVKCELSYAFDNKTEKPDFLWLAGWTVNVQLTLEINDSAGITPNGSYTSYRRSAVNFDAGPSTFPVGTARSVVPQFFTFGAGATLNSQATRTETLSFTIALDELKDWRRKQELLESDPAFPIEKRACNPEWHTGVLGNLGLKEWVDSAFFPVEAGALEAGIHPQPLSQKAANAPANKSNPAPSPTGREEPLAISCETMRTNIDRWGRTLKQISRTIESANAAVSAADKKITSSASSLDTKIGALKNDLPSYRYVMSDNLKQRLSSIKAYSSTMWRYVTNSAICMTRLKSITGNNSTLDQVDKKIVLIDNLSVKIDKSKDCSELLQDYKAIADKTDGEGDLTVDKSLLETKDDENAQNCAYALKKDADNSVILASALPSQIDPPVDSILHSVNFVITYGASISPSWTLIQWKGPASNSSLAGATGIRTNTLVLALGPRNGATAASPQALQLIQNQTVRALSN